MIGNEDEGFATAILGVARYVAVVGGVLVLDSAVAWDAGLFGCCRTWRRLLAATACGLWNARDRYNGAVSVGIGGRGCSAAQWEEYY